MTTAAPASEAVVLVMLRKGRGIDYVAGASQWSVADVRALAAEHGIVAAEIDPVQAPTIPTDNRPRSIDHEPSPVRSSPPPIPANLQVAHTPTAQRPGSDRVVDRRIQEGLAHPSKKVQMAARRVQAALDRLAIVEHEDAEKHAAKRREKEAKEQARLRVQRLEEQLREAKAALRNPRNANRVTGSTTSTSSPSDKLRYSTAVRQWAKDNGYAVADKGVMPRDIVEDYRAAHPEAATG